MADIDVSFDEHDEKDQYLLYQRAQEIVENNLEDELFQEEEFHNDG